MIIRELLTRYGFAADTRQIDNLNKKLFGVKGAAAAVAAGLTTAAGAVFAFAKVTHGSAIESDNLAARLGVNVEWLQELKQVAREANLDVNTIAPGLSALTRQLGQTGPAFDSFKKRMKDFGVSITDSSGKVRPMEDVLLLIAERTKELGNSNKSAQLAMLAMSESGAQMLPFLKLGARGMAGIGQETRKAGALIGEDGVAAARKFEESWNKISLRLRGVATQIGLKLLPVVQDIADRLLEWWKVNQDLINQKLEAVFAFLVDALQRAWEVMGKIVVIAKKLFKFFEQHPNLTKTAVALIATAGALKLVRYAVTQGTIVFKNLFALIKANPMAAFIAAASLAIAFIADHWDTIRAAFVAAWDGIKSAMTAVADWFVGIWDGIVDAFKSAWSTVAAWFKKHVIDPIADKFEWVANKASEVAGFFSETPADRARQALADAQSQELAKAQRAQLGKAISKSATVNSNVNLNVYGPPASPGQQASLLSGAKDALDAVNRKLINQMAQ